MKKWLCACDLSINGTSITLYNRQDKKYIFYSYNCKMPKKSKPFSLTKDNYTIVIERKPKNIGNKFLDLLNTAEHIFQKILELTDSIEIDFMIEDYSMGSKGMIFNIAEFTALFKNQIIKIGNTFETVSIATWKKNVINH